MKIGVALGGGGVRGLAHLPLLRLLDERNIRPTKIIGTSMGAIIGALYASGIKPAKIEERVRQHIVLKDDQVKDLLKKSRNLTQWSKIISPDFRSGGLIKADGLFGYLFNELENLNFEDLEIPFSAICCDYFTGKEIIIDSGPLIPAVKASMAVPGVFAPVEFNHMLLVDGGLVNNLGYELAAENTDLSIAIDVNHLVTHDDSHLPNAIKVAVGALYIMQHRALAQRLEKARPDILIRPDVKGIDFFNFHKMEKALKAGENARLELERALDSRLENKLADVDSLLKHEPYPEPSPSRWHRLLRRLRGQS